MQCAPGLQGPFCALCDRWVNEPNELPKHYFSRATSTERAQCKECKVGATASAVCAVLGGLCGFLALVSVLIHLHRKFRKHWVWKKLEYFAQVIKPTTKLKQIYGFLIITTLSDKVYRTQLPAEVEVLLSHMSIIVMPVNVDYFANSFQCIGLRSYWSQLAFWVCSPVVVVVTAMCGVATQLWRRGLLFRSLRFFLYQCLPLVLFILFLTYP